MAISAPRRSIAARFTSAGGGHLVLISSVLARRGVPGVKAAYAASKAGVSSLGESLRAEYRSGPIRIRMVSRSVRRGTSASDP